MIGKITQLRDMTLGVGWAVVVLSVFLCGCGESEKDRKDKETEACFEQAEAHYQAGRNDDAIAAFKKAIALKPDNARAYGNMGYAYDSLDQYDQAAAAYRKALLIKPDDPEVYLSMGFAYHKSEQRTKAVAAYEKAIALDPDGQTGSLARDALRR